MNKIKQIALGFVKGLVKEFVNKELIPFLDKKIDSLNLNGLTQKAKTKIFELINSKIDSI